MLKPHYLLADLNPEIIRIIVYALRTKIIKHKALISLTDRGVLLFGYHRYNLRIRQQHFSMKTLMQQTLFLQR